ncbi:MAG: lytic transglycosylase domain-containing protein [Agathobacter sp.]|nr:lytic transglycosylase domain-containing protein [Agathobacter sp.]
MVQIDFFYRKRKIMAIKVSTYTPTSSIDTSGKTTITDIPEEQSFQDVLVLNQTALKAMTIDAMVKQSATGSVNPDAVDAAAIMRFRSTLGANIQAPIPTDEWDAGTPIKVHVPPATPTITKPATSTTPSGNTPITNESVNNKNNTSTDEVPNDGVLACSEELNQYFAKAAETYGVDAKLLKCVAYAESRFRPDVTSKSGAMGVMQLMPKSAEYLGVTDAYDAEQNIMGGAKFLASLLKQFDGNIEYALAGYNAGPNRVEEYGGIPPYEETQNYVKQIMSIYNS